MGPAGGAALLGVLVGLLSARGSCGDQDPEPWPMRRCFENLTMPVEHGHVLPGAAGRLAQGTYTNNASVDSPRSQGGRPNILFVLSDQQRFDFDGFHAGIELELPHFTRLAAEGVRFTSVFSPSPLCSPSRTCLATGRAFHQFSPSYNFNKGPPDNMPTFYSALRDSGYHTMSCGKDDLQKKLAQEGKGAAFDFEGLHRLGFDDFERSLGKKNAMSHLKQERTVDQYGDFLQHFGSRNSSAVLDAAPDDVAAQQREEPREEQPGPQELRALRGRAHAPKPRPQAAPGVNRSEPEVYYSRWFPNGRPYFSGFVDGEGAADGFSRDAFKSLGAAYGHEGKGSGSVADWLPSGAQEDGFVGRKALQLLRRRPRDRPFFMQVNFPSPHDPYLINACMARSIRGREIGTPEGEHRSDAKAVQARRSYAALCETVDVWLGRLLGELEGEAVSLGLSLEVAHEVAEADGGDGEAGEAGGGGGGGSCGSAAPKGTARRRKLARSASALDATLVCFSSDHGDMLGDIGKWGKQVSYRLANCGFWFVPLGPRVAPQPPHAAGVGAGLGSGSAGLPWA